MSLHHNYSEITNLIIYSFKYVPIKAIIFQLLLQGDRIFPAGTAIMIPIAAVHFDPEYYPNPWEFNPQNFSPEKVESRPKHAYIPFSAGARNCIGSYKLQLVNLKIFLTSIITFFQGQNLAMLEMKLILTAFLRKFSFHTTMTMDDIKLNKAFSIHCLNGYNVSIKYRIKKPSYMN